MTVWKHVVILIPLIVAESEEEKVYVILDKFCGIFHVVRINVDKKEVTVNRGGAKYLRRAKKFSKKYDFKLIKNFSKKTSYSRVFCKNCGKRIKVDYRDGYLVDCKNCGTTNNRLEQL